jgi:cell division protein FtsQ
MAIDPKLMERRKVVAEDKARRNVGRLLRVLVVAGVVGALTWLALSPYLSVSEVRVAGVGVSDTYRTLAIERVVAGTPMILLRAGEVERALERDPWIAEADVDLDWPDTVIVRIEERVPAAWVETRGGWVRRAMDGVALPSPPDPDASMAWVQLRGIRDGVAADAPEVLGALEFVVSLTPKLRTGTLVRLEADGELWAQVDGYQVRLGRPVDMSQKAMSLMALLETDPARSEVLVLIAPTHPAVAPMADAPSRPDGDASGGPNRSDDGATGDREEEGSGE